MSFFYYNTILKQKGTFIHNDEKEVRDYSVDELNFKKSGPKARIEARHEKELKRLEDMDKKEGKSKIDG